VLAGLAGTLSSCVSPSKGAMKVEGSTLVVAVCEPFRADYLRINVVDGGDATEVWRAAGEADLVEGDLIHFGVAPEGMLTDVLDNDSPFDGLVVSALISKSDGGVWVLAAAWDELRTDAWRNQDGQYTDGPCAGR
jgi:hypothetical protein